MNHEVLLKLSDIIKPDLIKSLSDEKENVPMIDKIVRTIGINTEGLSEKEIENIISNYVFISEKVRSDLIEIEERIKQLKILDVDGVEEYTRKKYRHFSQLNKNARDKIISFTNSKFITYLLEHKAVDYYSRQDDRSLMFMLDCMYEYAHHRKYFDYNYDFSSEAKYHFTPGATIFQTSQVITEYASLKKSSIENYYTKIHENNVRINLSERLENIVRSNYYISKRSEIFNTLNKLYSERKYQSFISLAVLQIEGLFHDYCVLSDEKESNDNTGTLVEKAEKVLTLNRHYELAIYPYYAFDVPIMRNEIAHKGIMSNANLQQIADEILIDLHAILSQICEKINTKYIALFMLFEKLESLEDKSDSNIAMEFMTELFEASQAHGSEFIRVLREPDKYKHEYLNAPNLSELGRSKFSKEIDDLIQYLSTLVFGLPFWKVLKTQMELAIKNGIEHEHGKPFDFISFAISMKNDFIGKLPNQTDEKEMCQQLSALLKPFI